MSASLAAYLAGSACYAVAAVFAIRLRDGRQIMPAAALAPALAVAGRQLEADGGGMWLVAAPVALAAALLLAGRPPLELAVHLVLLRVSMFLAGVDVGLDQEVATLLVTGLGSTTLYSAGWAAGRHAAKAAGAGWEAGAESEGPLDSPKDKGSAAWSRGAGRGPWMWPVAHGVLLSACGLVMLVARELGWPAFGAMLVVLLVTKSELEAYGRAEKAYAQTVTVLEGLTAQEGEI